MKLNIFNSWKPLGTFFSKPLEYQTSKLDSSSGRVFAVYVRDAKSKNLIVKLVVNDQKAAPEVAQRALNRIGGEAVWKSIETGEPVSYNPSAQIVPKTEDPEKKIEWRDGTNHRYRAQKRIVGEQEEVKAKPRNFVAKHSRLVNKAGPMKDKKNDYQRKPKHKKKVMGED